MAVTKICTYTLLGEMNVNHLQPPVSASSINIKRVHWRYRIDKDFVSLCIVFCDLDENRIWQRIALSILIDSDSSERPTWSSIDVNNSLSHTEVRNAGLNNWKINYGNQHNAFEILTLNADTVSVFCSNYAKVLQLNLLWQHVRVKSRVPFI